MVTREALARQIEFMFPEFGKSGKDFEVSYDKQAHAWSIDLHQGKFHLKTFLDGTDADSCIDNKKCIPLALQLGQLKKNFNQYLHEHALERDN